MDKVIEFFTFYKRREQANRSFHLQKNGSLLLEDLIATFGARYNVPIRIFTAQQLIRSTNNFSQDVNFSVFGGNLFKGNLEERPVLVQHMRYLGPFSNDLDSLIIRDIAIASQMRHHKGVLPLIGCCLELKFPALVFDNALDHEFVAEALNPSFENKDDSGKRVGALCFRKRIKIAKDISSVLTYLHTAFPTPIIFRDLHIKKVALDNCGVAKLLGFGFSISLPPGETKVEDKVVGTSGFGDPEYVVSGIVTEKTDVFGMGLLMLQLFAGITAGFIQVAGEMLTLPEYAKRCIKNNQFKQFVDPQVFEGEGQNEDQNILQHLLACTHLALRCTEREGANRPEMIDVAKELSRIEKSLRS